MSKNNDILDKSLAYYINCLNFGILYYLGLLKDSFSGHIVLYSSLFFAVQAITFFFYMAAALFANKLYKVRDIDIPNVQNQRYENQL